MYYTYILLSSKDNKLYIGYSDNLKRRVEEHNNGKVNATKNRRPLFVIYYSAFLNRTDATSMEQYLKTQWGRRFIKKILYNYFNNTGG